MRLSKWASAVVEADADYFLGEASISQSDNQRVKAWLAGKEDLEIQGRIKRWLYSDAEYMKKLRSVTCRFLWWVYPLAWLAITIMQHHLRKESQMLIWFPPTKSL